MAQSALLDSSFFLRLLDDDDPLCQNAEGYYRYFLEQDIHLILSSIVVGEFCVKGTIDELPLKDLQRLPYNLNHAIKAGSFANLLLNRRDQLTRERPVILNDVKLFAQAEVEESIEFYVTSDSNSHAEYKALDDEFGLSFKFVDIHTLASEYFGFLDL